MIKSNDQYIAQCLELVRDCFLYYQALPPDMQSEKHDSVYDQKLRELQDYEAAHPEAVVSFSPTQFVDFDYKNFSYGEQGEA